MRFILGQKMWFIRGLLVASIMVLSSIWFARWWMDSDTRDRIHIHDQTIPARRVGLVLGCSSHLSNGQENSYFIHRVNAARHLYVAGKIKFILVSGDNHVSSYDEAGDMKNALMRQGVPEAAIVCDYAGFSTIDSVVRAKAVFGQSHLIVISQKFHLQRALFIAKRKQIDAIGFCAGEVNLAKDSTALREQFARVKTVLDIYLLHRKPIYLGEPVLIGSPATPPPDAGISHPVAIAKPSAYFP